MRTLIGWLCYRFILAWLYPPSATGIVGWALANVRMSAVPPIGRTTRIEVRTDEEPDDAR